MEIFAKTILFYKFSVFLNLIIFGYKMHTAQEKNNTKNRIREMFKIFALFDEILRRKINNFRSKYSPIVIHAFHFTKSPEMIVVVQKRMFS